jgi:hypothetical protein
MPIYIANELVREKDGKLFKRFQNSFEEHLDPQTKKRLVTPITIKYIPSLIKPMGGNQKLNKGKIARPKSLEIRHRSQIQLEDSVVDVRYTKTTPTRDKFGDLIWNDISTDVDLQINTTDIDLAFFFYAYSKDNVINNPNGQLKIEDKGAEMREVATVKRNEAIINARLWNPMREGGCGYEKLLEFALTRPSIVSPVGKDEDWLRIQIDQEFKMFGSSAKIAFLDATQPERIATDVKVEKENIANLAIKYDIIKQVPSKKEFRWVETDEVIWCWQDSDGFEKPIVKLGVYLETYEKATYDKLVALIEAAENK